MPSGEALEVLRQDIAAFADPGTAVEVGPLDQTWHTVRWQEGGRARSAQFSPGERVDLRDTQVRPETDGAPITYATFLASDRIGDLKNLARNTLRVINEVEAFVAPRAIADGEEEEPKPALNLVQELAQSESDATAVVFLTADAGVGKTTLLTEAVRRSAENYLEGADAPLWLYVNAQGSRLARLDQALAAALDDLRARFPYHAAATLVRAGAIVLVVDGFDELIGTQGTYDEAFSSLASFIERLRGSGSIVAAARSAYYEQEFAVRADSSIGFRTDRWALRPVQLCEWTPAERDVYLDSLADSRGLASEERLALKERVAEVLHDPDLADLASKPLFVSRIAEIFAESESLAQGENLVDRLVTTYLTREAETKLVSAQGTPLLSVDQLKEFYAEIANEMWRQETRELSRTSLRELVEILADLNDLDEDARGIIIERTPYSAVMKTGSTPGTAAFEHEVYFSFFLSKPIVEACRSGEALNVVLALRKGRLPNQSGALAGIELRGEGAQAVASLLAQAAEVAGRATDAVRQNGGLILAGVLKGTVVEELTAQRLDFVDCDLGGATLVRCGFVDCTFRGTDLRGTRFVEGGGENLVFEAVVVDEESRIELEGVPLSAFFAPVLESAGTRTPLYRPDEVATLLRTLRLPAAEGTAPKREIDPGLVEVVTRLARIYSKTNLATPDDDQSMRHVVSDKHWETVREALLGSGVIREEVRSASGNKTFMRMLVRSRDLVRGQAPDARTDARVAEFWRRLEQAGSSLSV